MEVKKGWKGWKISTFARAHHASLFSYHVHLD